MIGSPLASRLLPLPTRATLSAAAILAAVIAVPSPLAVAENSPATRPAGRRSVALTQGWRFCLGDPAGAEAAEFDDAAWQKARVPHDWAVAGPFDPAENGYAGKLPWRGVGWYRRHVKLDEPAGTRVYLDFDGVMAFPQVYVNGHLAGEWDYGYTPFRIDATPFVNLHGDNVVAVRVDTTKHQTRWYPGAGIYRKATLELRSPVHVDYHGVFVTTPQVADDRAEVQAVIALANCEATAAQVELVVTVLDPDGKQVAKQALGQEFAPGASEATVSLSVAPVRRWDVDHPELYTLEVAVLHAGEPVDEVAVPFGIRTFEFTADDGFHMNGRRVQLQGVNLHHDLGPLGAAFHVRAAERQLEIMQEIGVNALRTSHNPPAAEVLDLCDRMGIVVWDEAFDKWNGTADRVDGKPSHREHAERHLGAMMKRDRNHPSVVVWSIGNEIPGDREGVTPERVAMIADLARSFDATRPVGLGCHIPQQVAQGMFDKLDLTGWNYARRYAAFRQRSPHLPIIYSESASALSTRGFYELPLPGLKTEYSARKQVDSYDLNAAPWSDLADVEFRLMEADPFVAGEFVWTGFDYIGEPTPFEQDAKSSYFGIVDLCGIPKDRYWLYRSHWRRDVETVHILPHWNWPDRVGQPVPVFVYTSGDSAELFLNGRSLGRRTKGEIAPRPMSLTQAQTVAISASAATELAALAIDDRDGTAWRTERGTATAWLQLDFGVAQQIGSVHLRFRGETKNYGYRLQVSDDATTWETVSAKAPSDAPMWGAPREGVHHLAATGRYLRVDFTETRNDAAPEIVDVRVYPAQVDSPYYDVTRQYRLRWDDVLYEPGELKAVAYRGEEQIGVATMRTPGPPASLRLSPDRDRIKADGDDLSFVLVEALDEHGVPCPLAGDKVRVSLSGPAEVVGLGNGDPLSLEPFQGDAISLFHGKAMVVVRSRDEGPGAAELTAEATSMMPATSRITVGE